MKKIILIGAILSTVIASAQKGIGTKDPHKSSVLELKSKKRGILIPRIKLKATNLADPVTDIDAEAISLLVYNTASSEASIAEANKVSPGYYYWNGSKWVRVIDTDSQVETEWVYNANNQHIELKRSGTSPFANQVYYDEKGGFKSLDFNEYANHNGSTWETLNLEQHSGQSVTSKNSSKVTAYAVGGQQTKVLNENISLVDETTSADLHVIGNAYDVKVKKENNQTYNLIQGISSEASQQGEGDAKHLVGGSFDANINSGTSSGYITGLRSGSQVKGGANVNDAFGVTGFVTVDNNTNNINRVAPANFNVHYKGGTNTIAKNYTIRAATTLENGANPTITDAAGFYYEGIDGTGTATITNHYGIYLKDVNKATNNYSIYTNAGKAYFGDKVGIGVNNPNERLEVDGKVKAYAFIAKAGAFPDYVFEKYYNGYSDLKADYDFYSLETVENFIKKNGHLPGYQSAKEVAKEGFDMSATQLANVEKIEELYLHTIEQDKTIKAKTAKIEQMEAELNAQRKEIDELKSLVNKLINK